VQRALIRLGYDLGPKGADGVFGKKSTWALREFELSSGATQSESDGILDWKTLSLLEQSMKKLGVDGVINA
jgi:peptidoglycan hydrolase-like protein with peptidoglycan-binding domain